ncbi:putative Ig domain-containing protein, partial [Paenibacillus contaminans]
PEPITFITTSLPNGKAGTPYAVTLESSGGIGTRNYSLVSGGLPIGTAFSSAGVFSGTPSVAGTYTFTLRVTDSQPASASQSFTIVIAP